MDKQEFRYTKKEIFAGVLGIIGCLLLLGFWLYIRFLPRLVNKTTRADYIAIYIFLAILIMLMVYFFYFWLRRRTFCIKVNDDGLTISRFDKVRKINWEEINYYVYQCGHPYWFLSLHLTNEKRINLYGKLEDFDELVGYVKEKIKYNPREFQYTIRRMLGFIFTIYSIAGAGIMIIIPLIYWLVGRKSWFELLGFILLALILFGGGLLEQLRISQIKIFVNDDGLLMKPWLGKQVFISWLEIRNGAQIELSTHQATIVTRIPKITIRVKNNSISFCKDLDNIDELVSIIEQKTGSSLGI